MDTLSCLRHHTFSSFLCAASTPAFHHIRISTSCDKVIPLRSGIVPRGLSRGFSPLSCRVRPIRRNVLVRSDMAASAASSSAPSNLHAESELAARIRGTCFYAVTAITSIPLFFAMVLLHPIVILFDRHRRSIHHLVAKLWARLTIAPFYRIEFEGLENLPPMDVPSVYVSNHQSFLDIYTLLTLGRSFKFISKRAIFLFPIIGWAMYLMGLIPLRRVDTRSQLDCLKRCTDLVKKGASVFFFPEGTRSKDGKLGSFKKGAFSIAAKTGVPVVPITLLGTGQLMPAGRELFLYPGPVKVVIHKPLEGSNAEKLCDESMAVIANTLMHHDYPMHTSA